jgi:HNH endonuclease
VALVEFVSSSSCPRWYRINDKVPCNRIYEIGYTAGMTQIGKIPIRGRDGTVRTFTRVDVEDSTKPEISWKPWRLNAYGYAVRGEKRQGKFTQLFLHRVILNAPPGMEVDHVNGDQLDNRRCNLRLVTHAQNQQNRKQQRNNSSGFRGISWYPRYRKWQVLIWDNRHRIHLGYFTKLEDAVATYDAASRKYHPFASHRRDKT